MSSPAEAVTIRAALHALSAERVARSALAPTGDAQDALAALARWEAREQETPNAAESKHLSPSEPGRGSGEARASSGDERNSPASGRPTQDSAALGVRLREIEPLIAEAKALRRPRRDDYSTNDEFAAPGTHDYVTRTAALIPALVEALERVTGERAAYHDRLGEVNVERQRQEVRAELAEGALAAAVAESERLREALEWIAAAAEGAPGSSRLPAQLVAVLGVKAREALAGGAAAPPPEHLTAWLIERGQAERHSPTVWWIGDPDATSRDDEGWTQDAYKATWFARREAAQAVIDRLFTGPLGDVTARATEHGFASRSAVASNGEET